MEERIKLLEEYLTMKLDGMQSAKERMNIETPFVTKEELFKSIDTDIRNALNVMYSKKEIAVHPTAHAPIKDYVELIRK